MTINVQDHGTIWLLTPKDDEAKAFMDAHVEDPPDYMRVSGALAFDWRMGRDFAVFFQASGGQLTLNDKEVTIR